MIDQILAITNNAGEEEEEDLIVVEEVVVEAEEIFSMEEEKEDEDLEDLMEAGTMVREGASLHSPLEILEAEGVEATFSKVEVAEVEDLMIGTIIMVHKVVEVTLVVEVGLVVEVTLEAEEAEGILEEEEVDGETTLEGEDLVGVEDSNYISFAINRGMDIENKNITLNIKLHSMNYLKSLFICLPIL